VSDESRLSGRWEQLALADIAVVVQGQSPPGHTYNTSRVGLPFLQGKAEFGAAHPVPVKWCSRPQKTAAPGDVLISIRAPVGPTNLADQHYCIGRGLAAVRPLASIQAEYLLHYLRHTVGLLVERAKGTTFDAIGGDQLREHPVLLPPLGEQRRIVEAIESYLSRLDEAAALLERVRRNLKRYRAAVLKAAVEGRLVPTEAELARAEGRDYEPADVLLKRVLAERRSRWEESQVARMRTRGKPPKDEHWKARYQGPPSLDGGGLPRLPEGWCWVTLDLLKDFSLYGPRYPSEAYSDTGPLVLRTSDISESGKVDVESAPRVDVAKGDFERYRVQVGDLLITRTGSIGTLAVFSDSVDAIPGAYLIQYRLAAPVETSWFCFYFLKSREGQRQLKGGSAGVGRPNLNAPTIDEIAFGLPPLAEQRRIREEVGRLLSLTDDLVDTSLRALRRCRALREAILTWAFGGKLVDQDPTDEPASVLLERIRQETAATRAPDGQKRAKLQRRRGRMGGKEAGR